MGGHTPLQALRVSDSFRCSKRLLAQGQLSMTEEVVGCGRLERWSLLITMSLPITQTGFRPVILKCAAWILEHCWIPPPLCPMPGSWLQPRHGWGVETLGTSEKHSQLESQTLHMAQLHRRLAEWGMWAGITRSLVRFLKAAARVDLTRPQYSPAAHISADWVMPLLK